MKSFLLLAILLIQFVSLQKLTARLGEDQIQCEDRYGFAQKQFVVSDKISPLIAGEGTVTRTYLYQGWRIRVGFLNDIAVREEYFKIAGPGRPITITEYESNAILDGEKGTGSWAPKGTTLSLNLPKMLQDRLRDMLAGTVWIRSDGTATASLDIARMHVAFESLAAIQHDDDIKQANERKQRASVPAF